LHHAEPARQSLLGGLVSVSQLVRSDASGQGDEMAGFNDTV